MKRKIIALLLMAVAAFSAAAFTACGKDKDEIAIASFESYEELTSMRYLNQFGSAELSDEHVTQGKKSLHVSAMGKAGVAAKPVICIETKTDRLKKYDFTDVDKFMLDVYNDNDYEANVYFQYLTAAEENKTSGEIKATVPAKTAKTVEFEIDRALCSYFLNLDDVLQLRIAFDPITEHGEAYRSFYIDNLRCHTTKKGYTPMNPRKADEIESADRSEYLAAWGYNLQYVYAPQSLAFNDDPQYIKSGTGSFKLTSECTDGRDDGSGEYKYTIGIKCVNNTLNPRDYAAIGYWVYNANDVAVDAYTHRNDGTFNMGSLPAGQWTYLEITQSMLRSMGFEDSFEGLEIWFRVSTDKKHTFYIDEICALKDDLTPTITVDGDIPEYADAPATVTVPVPTLKYADEYTVKVYDKNNALISEDKNSFTAEIYGTYKIVYTATARRADASGNYATAEATVEIVVGKAPVLTNLPEDKFAPVGEYTLALPECDDGEVTWTAEVLALLSTRTPGTLATDASYEGICKGGVIEHNDDNKVYVFRDYVTRVKFSVTNSRGITTTAYQTLVNFNNAEKLSAVYPEIYSGATVNGDLTKLSGEVDVLGDKGGLRFANANGVADGTFTPANGTKLGASNDDFRFTVINNGAQPVTFKVNANGDCVIPAKGYMVFYGRQFGYEAALQGWNIVGKDSERTLLPLAFHAESSDAIDLSIGFFTISAGSYVPVVKTDYEESYNSGEQIDVNALVSVAGADGFAYAVYRKGPNDADYGAAVKTGTSDDESTVYTLTNSGIYKIEYTVTYTDGGTEKQVKASAEFRVISREISFASTPQDAFAAAGNVTVTPPTSEYGSVGWEVELIYVMSYKFNAPDYVAGTRDTSYNENGYTAGVITGSPSTFYLPANYAARIKYTLTDSNDEYNTAVTYQTYVNFTDSVRLSSQYPNVYTDATLSAGLTKSTDFGIFGVTEETFRLRGTSSEVNVQFTPPANTYLGSANTNIRFVVYNNGAKKLTFRHYAYGNNFVVMPGCYAVYNPADTLGLGYEGAIKGWKVIDEDGNLNTLDFRASSEDNGAVDVYVGYLTVNEGSFEPFVSANVAEQYTEGASVNFAELITVKGATSFGYTVMRTTDGTKIAEGTSDENSPVTLSEVGAYEVTYTVNYVNGTPKTKQVTKNFTVTAFSVSLGKDAVKRVAPNATYSIRDNLPVISGVTVTEWTVQRYPAGIMYNSYDGEGFKPVELVASGAPDYTQRGDDGLITSFGPLDNMSYKVVYTLSNGTKTTTATQWLLADNGDVLKISEDSACGKEPGTEFSFGTVATESALIATGSGNVGYNFKPAVALDENLTAFSFWIMIESEAETAFLNLGKNGNEWGGKNIPTGVWVRADLPLASHLKGWGIIDANNVFQELGIRVTGTGNTTVYVGMFCSHT